MKVAAKDTLNAGDRILLPQSVQQKPTPTHKPHSPLTPQQINFIRTLVIHKVFNVNYFIYFFFFSLSHIFLLYQYQSLLMCLGSCHSRPQQTSRNACAGMRPPSHLRMPYSSFNSYTCFPCLSLGWH